jgi:hypothetical protein
MGAQGILIALLEYSHLVPAFALPDKLTIDCEPNPER